MNELLAIENELLQFFFGILTNILNSYYFVIMLVVAVSLVISVVFYMAKMARTHA